ncbi:hypothetical protein BJX70DRAFT_401418 [Aspergillus crustosus]
MAKAAILYLLSRAYSLLKGGTLTSIIPEHLSSHASYRPLRLKNTSSFGNNLLIRRSQWSSVTRDIDSLSTQQLQDAAGQLAAGKAPIPAVQRLLKNITAIGVQVPGSFFQKLQMRAEIRGLLVRDGMPAF